MSTSKHTSRPWRWLSSTALVGDHGRRPIVLTASRDGSLRQRSLDGLLMELDPRSPDALLIAAAPELLEACELALETLRIAVAAHVDVPDFSVDEHVVVKRIAGGHRQGERRCSMRPHRCSCGHLPITHADAHPQYCNAVGCPCAALSKIPGAASPATDPGIASAGHSGPAGASAHEDAGNSAGGEAGGLSVSAIDVPASPMVDAGGNSAPRESGGEFSVSNWTPPLGSRQRLAHAYRRYQELKRQHEAGDSGVRLAKEAWGREIKRLLDARTPQIQTGEIPW